MVTTILASSDYTDTYIWVTGKEDAGNRLDRFLSDQDIDCTRSFLKKIIDAGHVEVDGRLVRPAQKLRQGQKIVLKIPPQPALSLCAQQMDLNIRFEDDFLIVIDKPQGLVVHPAPGHPDGTLVNGLLFGRQTRGGDPLRPGIVHRLDKNTSGLIVVAKNESVHAKLAEQFQVHSVDRRYRVLVVGSPPDQGEWNTLHGRHPKDRRRFTSRVTRGKTAVSRFVTLERFKGAAMLQVTLFTGRTHQVRVHCFDHGFPVLGDPDYGPRHLSPILRSAHQNLPGQALHAELLGFTHPTTRERLCFESTPPGIFLETIAMIRAQ